MGGVIDVQKAFDSTQHGAMWRPFRNHSISEQYICLLKKSQADQRATVLTDVDSDEFEIARGTRTDFKRSTEAQGLEISPSEHENSHLFEIKQVERNRDCRECLGQMIHSSINKLPRYCTESSELGPRSPDIDRNGHPSLMCSVTRCISLTVLSTDNYVWRRDTMLLKDNTDSGAGTME